MSSKAGVRTARPRVLAALLSLVAVAIALAGVAPGAAPAGASPRAAADATQTVSYAGYRVEVPASWPVIDLAQQPATCVRFDEHVVYLGHPGQAQDCPTHVYGRTEALVLEPNDATSQADRRVATPAQPGTAPAPNAAQAAEQLQRIGVAGSGVVVTASWGDDRPAIDAILRSGQLVGTVPPSTTTPGGTPAPSTTAPSPATPAPSTTSPPTTSPPTTSPPATTAPRSMQLAPQASATVPPVTSEVQLSGQGFDACSLPRSTSTMASIKSSTGWVAAGFYLGGLNAGCPQLGFGASWVQAVVSQGWGLMPIWVGRQGAGACGGSCATIDSSQARSQGSNEADSAVAAARSVGIGPSSPIYLDMEAYNTTVGGASAAVVSFIQGWTAELHALGYTSGFYSSAASGITDVNTAAKSGAANLPDSIWIAHYDCVSSLHDAYLSDASWAHHRIRQYRAPYVSCSASQPNVGFQYDQDILDGDAAGHGTPTGTDAFVKALFADFLGRAPSASELSDWVALASNADRTVIANALANSPEWVSHIVDRFYFDTFGRAPDSAGAAFWRDQITSGTMTVAQVAAQFYGSTEYFQGYGNSDLTTWVDDLYAKLLHRVADPAGRALWVGVAQSDGRAAVTYPFYQSLESAHDRVTTLYETLLGRKPDTAGLDYWSDQVRVHGDVTLAASLAGSQEYYQRAETRF